MRCPACQTENASTAATCSQCQAALTPKPRKPRRKQGPQPDPDSPEAEAYNRQVRRIFNLCLWSLIPVAGLVLGPLGALLAWRLIRRARHDPAFTALKGTQWALYLGSITGAANLLGVSLMALGYYLG